MQQTAVRENGITEGVIWKQLLAFFFPILLGTFFQQLYNTADAVIVGRFVGKEALAAVGGPTSTLINLFVNFFVGIASGTTVIIAQYYGGQHQEDLRRAVHTSAALAVILGAGMTLVGLVLAPWALRAIGTPEEIMGYSLTYIRIYFLGTIPSFLYNIGAGILRAVGDTRRPLYFLIAACLTNIVLDLLFVVQLGLGVFGVAAATLISQILSAVLVVFALVKAEGPCHLEPKEIRVSRRMMDGIFRVGIPAGLQSNMYAISNIIIQSCINSFGTDTIAAWTAFGKIDGFFWMIMGAYGISITTFVGQNFGAQKYERIHKSVRVCLGLAMGTAVAASLILCVLGSSSYRLFTTDQEVIATGVRMLNRMVPFYFTYVCVEVLSGAIRGVGDSLVPMLMTCGGICLLRILWIAFVLPLHRDMDTVVMSYPITWTVTSLFFIVYYLRGRWLRRCIAHQEAQVEPLPLELS